MKIKSVLCYLNGPVSLPTRYVEFVDSISEDLTQEEVDRLLTLPGFELVIDENIYPEYTKDELEGLVKDSLHQILLDNGEDYWDNKANMINKILELKLKKVA